MGFLTRLFGSSKRGSLQDSDFGDFTELNRRGEEIIWKGQVKIFDETISLYMSGNSSYLDLAEKAKLINVLKNEVVVEAEVNEALREQYEDADKHYSNWRTHFNCITMSTMGDETSITFEEKNSLHQFNVFLLDCKANGVSIDG
jgi:hypothetical protein